MNARPPVDEVIALELRLLDPQIRASPGEVDLLLHEDFAEVGASGRRWDRASTIESLASETGPAPEVTDLVARPIADQVVLVTYLDSRPDEGRSSFRCSLWVMTADGWRVLYHQGTWASDSDQEM
jgi:hypothetical protein